MKILIINGHPREGSFSDAIVKTFAEHAGRYGASVEKLTLRELDFVANVLTSTDDESQLVESDFAKARELLLWCDHLVVVFPTWWAGAPALLKSFFDRVFSSGFAFEETTGGTGYRGLLGSRSAHVITTMDTPGWVFRWIHGRPVTLAINRCTLGFCGLSPVRESIYSEVKHSTPDIRAGWLAEVAALGRQAARGPTRWEKFSAGAKAWLQAMRLQFYPMTLLAYLAGALGAVGEKGLLFQGTAFVCGYLFLFLIEVATVFSNDVFDFQSDRQNRFYGPFSGGSRVLIDGKLKKNELGFAAIVTMIFGLAFGALAGFVAEGSDVATAVILLATTVLAIGYTVPPLKLSHRGLGEIAVCLTHSFAPIVCGYVLQGAAWNDPFPWLLALPLCVAIMPSILLAGIPDRQADAAAGKRTMAVKLGVRRTIVLSAVFTCLAVLATWLWSRFGLADGAYTGSIWLTLPVGGWLLWRLKQVSPTQTPRRLDGTIAIALLLVLGFTSWMVARLTFF